MSHAVVVRAGEGESVEWGPSGRIRVVAAAETTDGTFGIVEAIEPPGSAAPLHVHHGEAEAFWVVEGTIELTCGDDAVTATQGDFVYTPRGVAHKYVVVGDEPARILLLFSRPGFERFFLDAGGPFDQQRLQRALERYDLEVLETSA